MEELPSVVWSVIYFMLVGLTGTGYAVYYILRQAYLEMRDERQDIRGSESGRTHSSVAHES